MNFAKRNGQRLMVLRPTDPEAAVKHAEKCMKTQTWQNYQGETRFVGYLAETHRISADPAQLLDAEGNVIGDLERGDIFATQEN